MKDVKVNIPSMYFPSQFVSDEEKASLEYGLKIGQAIQYEWFRRDGNNGRYYDRYRNFHKLRLYARGEQSVAKYKKELAVDGDLSYLNLDWTPVPILPKFVDIVVNGMSSRPFTIKAEAQDAMSADEKNAYQEMVKADMIAKPVLQKIKDEFGVDTFNLDPDQIPANDDELNIHLQLNYKPAIEIAEETAINTILEDNDYDDTRKRIDYDLAVLGMAVAKHEFNPGSGVEVKYVDPANVIHSYTEDPYFNDCFYWGEIKTVPITELVKIDPSLRQEDLEKISKYSQNWYNYYNVQQYYQNDTFYRDTATLLYFNYKTTNTFKYKKKISEGGAVKMVEKDSAFNPPPEMIEEGRFEVIEKTIDVWYEGVMVMGTDIILRWNMMENMVRPASASQHALPNYVAVAPRMYKGNVESLVRRMIPYADLIQITHLKIQQVMNRMTPDGVFIDADGLNEIDLGTGAAYNPEDALRMYFQTGSVVGRSYTQDGEFNNARVPIQPITGHSSQGKLQALLGNYNYYLDMIRSVTGLNEARDGSSPDPDALVGVQKLAAANSNTATRHIMESSMFVVKRLAQALSCRIADILEYYEFAEEFAMQIGKYNVAMLSDIKDLYMRDFGVFIQVAPDEEQKAMLEQNIQMALSKNDINLEDAIDIREINNTKVANQLLKIKRTKNKEAEQQQQMAQQQMQMQMQMQSQQQAAQNAQQKLSMEHQVTLRELQAGVAFEIEKLKNEAQIKSQMMQQQFQYDYQIAMVKEQKLGERNREKEDAKDERIDRQNTQQSRLINQRKKGGAPIDFMKESEDLNKVAEGVDDPFAPK